MKPTRTIFIDRRDWLRAFDDWYPAFGTLPPSPRTHLAYLVLRSLGCYDLRISSTVMRHSPRRLRLAVAAGHVRPRLNPVFLRQIDHYLQTRGIQ